MPTGSLQVIYDPMTGNPDGTGRTPFPGNIIPANRLNPIAQKLLGLYPAAELRRHRRRQSHEQLLARGEQRTTDRDNYDVKVNFNRTASHQIWGKFSMLDAVVDDLTYYLGPDTNSDQDGGFTKVYMGTGGQTWTLDRRSSGT